MTVVEKSLFTAPLFMPIVVTTSDIAFSIRNGPVVKSFISPGCARRLKTTLNAPSHALTLSEEDNS